MNDNYRLNYYDNQQNEGNMRLCLDRDSYMGCQYSASSNLFFVYASQSFPWAIPPIVLYFLVFTINILFACKFYERPVLVNAESCKDAKVKTAIVYNFNLTRVYYKVSWHIQIIAPKCFVILSILTSSFLLVVHVRLLHIAKVQCTTNHKNIRIKYIARVWLTITNGSYAF